MIRPDSEAALSEAIRSGARGLPSGGGTRLLPGEVPGIDTRALTGVSLYEPAALTLVVGAGTPLAEVEALLAAENQMLAFEPPARPGSTIGGVCAANASGPRRVLAGAARDAMIGIRMVDGTGAVIANGGRVMKNVTGYDLVKLAAGSRGRLGVLTEVALKTAPRPPATAILRLALPAADAIPALTAALAGPFDVSAALWTPTLGAVLRLEGLPASVALRRDALQARLAPFGPLAEDDPALALDDNILGGEAPQAAGGQTVPPATGDLWRILCRPSQAAAILATLDPIRIDWGGALILARLATPPVLPPGAVATRLTGAPGRLPPPDPVTAGLEAGLMQRFDPLGLFA